MRIIGCLSSKIQFLDCIMLEFEIFYYTIGGKGTCCCCCMICCSTIVIVIFGILLAVPILFGIHHTISQNVTIVRNSQLEMDIENAIYYETIKVSLLPGQQDVGNIYVTTAKASDIHYHSKIYSVTNAVLNGKKVVRYWPK